MFLLANILIIFLSFALVISVAGQDPTGGKGEFLGSLDAELSPDLVHVYQRKFDVVATKDLPKFEPALSNGTRVSSGELIARTGVSKIVGILAEPPGSAPFLSIDLNGNGKIETVERTELRKIRNDRDEYGSQIWLPIKNQHFKRFPVYFGYLKGFSHPRFLPGDTLTFQSVWAYAFGTVMIGRRGVRMQFPFEPDQPTMSTTEGLFGIDADGDGIIKNEEFSPETSYATKTEVVLRVGDQYVSTSKIDLAKNEITVRLRSKDEYLRFEIEVGKIMPDFSYVDLEKKTRNLYDLKGKYVLIDFWGVWCADCLIETPYHIEAYKRFRSRGLEILGLNTDEDIELLRAYVKKNGMQWPQARNESIRKLVEETYRIQEYPSTILIGPDAKVLVLDQKYLRGDSLINTLERILPK